MPTPDERIGLLPFTVGETYSRIEVAQLGGVTVPEGKIFSTNWSQGIVEFANAVILFVTLEKDEYTYEDEFDGELFWWQSQNRQHQSTGLIRQIADGELPCYLFVRIRAKTKSRPEPFVYCGALSRPEMEGERPVTCLFHSLDYVEGAGGKLGEVYAWSSGQPATPGGTARRRRLKHNVSTGGQGRLSDTELRLALELYGMSLAREHYEKMGWAVEDTSKNNPFDLLCTQDGTTRRVEVKATTTSGDAVLVTIGEVTAALEPGVVTDLFIVRRVQVSRDGSRRALSGGEVVIISPWRPDPENLHPTQFRHIVRSSQS